MKKKFLSIIALLTMAVASCTENIVPTEVVKSEVKCENRSLEEIIHIAQNAPSLFESKDETRGTKNVKKEIDLSSITSITNKDITRTSSAIDTLLYVMNYADNKGYVIVSSKQGTPGVIAYVEEGQYDLDEMQDNKSDIGYVVNLATNYIVNTNLNAGLLPFLDTLIFTAGPFIETKWGQQFPEGIYCPNGYAGCANTAMAQILAYYEYPDSIRLTYDEADRLYQVLDWDLIKQHTIRHSMPNSNFSLICPADDETHNAIGRLCRQLGVLNNCSYIETDTLVATGNNEDNMKLTPRVLGYTDKGWTWYNDTCLIAPLTAGHPVIVSGFRNETMGHMWVVDGFIDMHITTYEAPVIGQPYGPTKMREIYNHVNWGWDGRSNGYFLSSIFDVSQIYQADPNLFGPVNTSYNYHIGLQYFEFYR